MEPPTEQTNSLSNHTWDGHSYNNYLLNKICDWSRPENTALEYHDSKTIKTITYSELEDTKTNVGDVLAAAKSEGFIAIDNDVKAFCVPGLILGIQDQKCAFINLPEVNKQELCSRLRIQFVFSTRIIPNTSFISKLNIHGEKIKLSKYESRIISESYSNEDNFAYAITTSGSTGKPKIVKVSHASIVPNILDLNKILDLSETDKIAQITNLTFDPSIIEIFLSLSTGGTLFVVSNEILNSPDELLRVIFERNVTVLQTTPSLWRFRWSSNDIKNTIFSGKSCLRILLIGGEPFPEIETFDAIKHPDNCTKIYNIYGITEVSCWASITEINFTNSNHLDTTLNQNLGKPLSQTIFKVKDLHGNVVRNGEGELYVGSDSRICVIDGEESVFTEPLVYRKTGDLVSIKDNNIFYKNRSDRIIKRLGNRIDLFELESIVLKWNLIQNCAALWDERSHKLYLCVSVINAEDIDGKFINNLRVREELTKRLKSLPPIYQPDEIKYLNSLQLTTSGKVCRRTLMKLFQNTEKLCSRVSNVEAAKETFKRIWKNSLMVKNNPDCRFLANGGNSVTAIQISTELSSALGSEFPELIGLLLKNESFANCMEYITKKVERCWAENQINDPTLSSKPITVRGNKRMKYNSPHLEKAYEPNACVWQKCRGKIIGDIVNTESPLKLINPKLSITCSRDLKKCVDASPTVFKYSSGDIYASVGSHAGVILTKQLNYHDSIAHIINLPDRIEASVLVLDELKGIIGCYDGNVYCLSLISGQVIWKFKTGDAVKCTAIFSDDKRSVFVGSYDKYFYSISVTDGSEIWKLKGSEGSISATPCVSSKSHCVVFGTLDGTCISLNQTSGQIIWKNKFRDPVFSAPAVLENGNIVFCSVSGEVNCFDSEAGLKIWKYKIDGNVFSHLVIRNDAVENTEDLIIGSNNKTLYCLTLKKNSSSTPVLKYSVSFKSPIFSTPYNENGILIVADTGGNISLLNSVNGRILCSLKLNGEVFSSPVINEDYLVVGCRDNNFYVIKINDDKYRK